VRLTFGRTAVKPALNWVAVVIAAAVVLIIGIVIAAEWTGIGDSDISGAGWLAMGLGVIVTLALGVGLMALVFISNRRGYDEIGRRDT
jgi:hypothetical protein